MVAHKWLLFMPQLPSSPSSLRVLVWRRVRAAGATGLQNGVWVFPYTPEHERTVRDLLAEIEPQGGSGVMFVATPLGHGVQESIIERFRADRDQEYTEFCERCHDFLAEIDKETRAENLTFAELEENEQDLHKLEGWLRKIQARDAFRGPKDGEASAALDECRQALLAFANSIYIREGLDPRDGDPDITTPRAK